MKIAIHHRENSFSNRWIAYCEKEAIPYQLVDCYASDIMEQMQACDVLMWHWHHADPKAVLFARQLTYSLEAAGKKVFPDSNTAWHFDDKVGQKYLLESIGAPMVPSYVFYDKAEALAWTEKTQFPKMFKLRGGAGASNVQLAKTKQEAQKLIAQAFGRGFSQFNRWGYFKESCRKFLSRQEGFIVLVKGLVRLVVPTKHSKVVPPERGYIYFQRFIPNNKSDIRVVVVGCKAFAIKRFCREGDFRASGSGEMSFDPDDIDERCVQISFDISKKMGAQSIAYDYVFDESGDPLIVEISYGFAMKAYDECRGWWSYDMQWHEGVFLPQDWMVENCLEESSS